jgi:hypothetical protein
VYAALTNLPACTLRRDPGSGTATPQRSYQSLDAAAIPAGTGAQVVLNGEALQPGTCAWHTAARGNGQVITGTITLVAS